MIAPILLGLALFLTAEAAAQGRSAQGHPTQGPPAQGPPAQGHSAQELSTHTIYLYRDGQAVAVVRPGSYSGDPQRDATEVLRSLLAGPTPAERTAGHTSSLPPTAELVAVKVSGQEVTVDLRLPPAFLHSEMDPDHSDAIVEQIVKTLHPLGLDHVHVRAEGKDGTYLPISAYLPQPPVLRPTIPANDDNAPERWGPWPSSPAYAGELPAFGQGQPQGALSGKTVWLSAGHGWYWSSTLNRWTTQRGNNHGLVEDFSNAEAVNYYLARYLWNAGADVWLVRERAMTENEVIVDNDLGAPAYTETGSWATSSTAGYAGGIYRWSSTSGGQQATATWRPALPEAGWYAVRAWYVPGGNRATDARYEIHHAGGVTEVSISQEVHGLTWRYLGEYYFEAGQSGYVSLVNESGDPNQAIIADAVRLGGGLGSIIEPGGSSIRPRWEEAAKYWARYQGVPAEYATYDSLSRPLYAEWETAKGYPAEAENAVYVSWHTNAGGGTGTDSFIHDTEPTPGSAELQRWIHGEVIHDLRAAWDPGWVDRGRKRADFGEVRELSTMPGVLLEVAFHDTEDPGDADDLREPVFRQIAARAVGQGIVKYFGERDGVEGLLSPEPPPRLVARSTGPGQVTLTWAAPPCCDGVGGDAASSYKVYQSASGRAFDNGTGATGTSHTLHGLAPGTLRFFRVTALNDGGESFPSPVVAVRLPAEGETPSVLIVDGFDRLDQAAMIAQWEAPFLGTDQRMFLERMNRHDYAIEHGQALSECGLAFDGAVNEAAESGDVVLGNYAVVDWFTGEDSTADAALSQTEQTLLATYLDGGGRLLISGSEIGYDLVEQGSNPAFYRDYLRAEYLGDDAGTHDFAGASGGPFDGMAGSFDDGSGGTYLVGYADRLAPVSGSAVVLHYAGGTGDGAAVVYDDTFGLVHFGFPLETVTDATVRRSLFCAATEFLLPGAPPEPHCTPRLINPGFEGGGGQAAWRMRSPDGVSIPAHRDDLPPGVEPHSGDWAAWLGGYAPGASPPGITTTAIITQVVALPAGEPVASLSLAWLLHPAPATLPARENRLTVSVYTPGGILLATLLTVEGDAPADTWQNSQVDLSAFAGQTIQLEVRAVSRDAAFLVDDASLTTCGIAGPDEYRALWVDAYHEGVKSRQQIDELVETAQAGNFNALLVQVRRRGDTYYPSAFDPWAPDAQQGFDALAYLIERAHAAGIEVHAWATTLTIWSGNTVPDSPEHTFHLHGPDAEGREDWLMYSDGGTGSTADGLYNLDPGHPDVIEYLVDIYAELAAGYEIDGLHLDRMRYPGRAWGYNPTAVARFQALTGRSDRPLPDDEQWLQWRRDQASALVRRIYLTATAINPYLRVSVAVSTIGNPPTGSVPWESRTPYAHNLQDWRGWLEEGILDLALPMTYRDQDAYAEVFDDWIEWEKNHQYGRGVIVGTGLYLNAVEDSIVQWQGVRQLSGLGNQALGVAGYSYATLSAEGTPARSFANAAITGIFDRPATVPATRWKDAPTLGHLAGRLTPVSPCLPSADGQMIELAGQQNRTLLSDGSGWFGAVDLPPGEYQLSVEAPAAYSVPVIVKAGSITELQAITPDCWQPTHYAYLPLVLK